MRRRIGYKTVMKHAHCKLWISVNESSHASVKTKQSCALKCDISVVLHYTYSISRSRIATMGRQTFKNVFLFEHVLNLSETALLPCSVCCAGATRCQLHPLWGRQGAARIDEVTLACFLLVKFSAGMLCLQCECYACRTGAINMPLVPAEWGSDCQARWSCMFLL